MKAIEQQGYGDPRTVLRQVLRPVPAIATDQVLVRVHAASANPADWHLVCGEPLIMRPALGGLRAPRRIIGTDFAGVVERIGPGVTHLAVGDDVYGYALGAFAEYVASPAHSTARTPVTCSYTEAAAVPLAGITALQGLRLGALEAGQKVMILGASGGVGTFAVQLAKNAGAEVTGVCSTGRMDLVRRLGADHVMDYTAVDPAAGPGRYDLILQLGGSYSARALRRRLTSRGALVQSMGDGNRWLGPLASMAAGAALNLVTPQRIVPLVANETTADLTILRGLIDDGTVRPVIDSEHPLDEAGDALALVRDGRPAGKVVLRVAT